MLFSCFHVPELSWTPSVDAMLISKTTTSPYVRHFQPLAADELCFMRAHFDEFTQLRAHGTSSPMLLGLKRFGEMEPLTTLLEEHDYAPFTGEIYRLDIGRTICMVDLPVAHEAAFYGRAFGNWKRSMTDEDLETSPSYGPLLKRVHAMRCQQYDALAGQEKKLIDEPFPMVILLDCPDARLVYGNTPEWQVPHAVQPEAMRLLLPTEKMHQTRQFLDPLPLKVYPLEVYQHFIEASNEAKGQWWNENREAIKHHIGELVQTDHAHDVINLSHREYIFWQDEVEQVRQALEEVVVEGAASRI